MKIGLIVFIYPLVILGGRYVNSRPPPAPRVELPNVVIVGKVETFSSRYLIKYTDVDVFLGIPYAEAPVGERRFELAEPISSWNGEVYNATQTPPVCMQEEISLLDSKGMISNISEDCLYLNIFVPKSLPPNATVMVWIHGGGLITGSGLSVPTNPVVLSAFTDVIVVTLNYRLGIFGFLSTGDNTTSSNIGLIDQQTALKWVFENIAAFGGDPGKVTIFGESSGGASVGWHLLSAESRKYFQRAILQSGDPLDPWAKLLPLEEVARRAQAVASLIQCDGYDIENSTELIDCLRKEPAENILRAAIELGGLTGDFNSFVAVEDGIFFRGSVAELIAQGDYRDIDLILGTNKHDGFIVSYVLAGFSQKKPNFTKELFSAIASGGSVNPLVNDLIDIIYAANVKDEGNYVDALTDAVGDTGFICSMSEFAKQVATAGSNVYMYHLTHEPVNSLFYVPWSRAGHYEELQFVFGWSLQSNGPRLVVYEDIKLSAYVMTLWANFAKTGNPNLSDGPRSLIKSFPVWPQFSPDEEEYKEIDIKFSNNRKLRQKYCNFWKNTLPKL